MKRFSLERFSIRPETADLMAPTFLTVLVWIMLINDKSWAVISKDTRVAVAAVPVTVTVWLVLTTLLKDAGKFDPGKNRNWFMASLLASSFTAVLIGALFLAEAIRRTAYLGSAAAGVVTLFFGIIAIRTLIKLLTPPEKQNP